VEPGSHTLLLLEIRIWFPVWGIYHSTTPNQRRT